MNSNLIPEEQFQTEISSSDGIGTSRSLDINSVSNNDLSSTYQDGDIPTITNLEELAQYLTELMIRFDASPKYYQKQDYVHLVNTIYNSLLYLYKRDNEIRDLESVIHFIGDAQLTTNPITDALTLNYTFPGIYLLPVSGSYTNFGLTISPSELNEAVILAVPVLVDNIFINYKKVVYKISLSNKANLSGGNTFSGNQIIESGSITFDNQYGIKFKNTIGAIYSILYSLQDWTVLKSLGSGIVFKNRTGTSDLLTIDDSGNSTFIGYLNSLVLTLKAGTDYKTFAVTKSGDTNTVVINPDDEYTTVQIGDLLTNLLVKGAITADRIHFVNGNISNPVSGDFYYDVNDLTVKFVGYDGTTLSIGEEEYILVTNKGVSNILNGSPIYISGAQADMPKASLAYSGTPSSSQVIGVATQDIPINRVGKVTTLGVVHDIDTRGFTAGDSLWLNGTVITNIKPTLGYNTFIGYAINSKNSNAGGAIFVSPARPLALDLSSNSNEIAPTVKAVNNALHNYINVTLSVASWNISTNTIIVTATGVTSNSYVIIGAPIDRTEYDAYATSRIICTSLGANQMTFTCDSVPNINISLTVKIE